MEPAAIARKLSGDGRIVEVGAGVGRLYRVWDGTETSLVKIYSSVSAERRERQALENLAGLPGLPIVVRRGVEEDRPWVVFEEPGKWNLASLPESLSLGRKAGEVLAALHRHETGHLSNVEHGMDADWINGDYPSTFKRLERYRGRLHLPAEVVARAMELTPPRTGTPVIIHTDPNPEQVMVDDDGNVTLFHWEWSTLGPPEWDYSRLLWLTRLKAGPDSAAGVMEGYGTEIRDDELERWSVYHSGMMLKQAVEAADQQLRGADWLVAELTRAVGALS
jgi:aminoglycoside phosphotransferase (APT) family kinase protein